MVFITTFTFKLISVIVFLTCLSILEAKGSKLFRLAGSTTPMEGRVEVYSAGMWGTVCMDDAWMSNANQDVVCRSLGFLKGVAVTTEYPSTARVLLGKVKCYGNEKDLNQCYSQSSQADTPFDPELCDDVGVQCAICDQPILSREDLVPSWYFAATSYKDTNPPHYARLNSSAAWCLHPLTVNGPYLENSHYLEIELPRLYLVSAVATFGGTTSADYVKSYTVLYRAETMEWNTASASGKQLIQGNSASGNEDIVKRTFDTAIRAKLVRFYPRDWGTKGCMRIELCGRQLPHKPMILLRETSATSVIISWAKPDAGDDVINQYYVRYWKVKTPETSWKFVEIPTTVFYATNLSPSTDYEVQVSAISHLGEGLRTSYFQRTYEAAPSGPPTSIEARFVGTTAVNITWALPHEDHRNGRISGYKVVVCADNAVKAKTYTADYCQRDTTSVELPASQQWYFLRDVDFTVGHIVQIRAVTALGTGPTGEITTGVLEYTPPDGKASSLTIVVAASVVLIALVITVILAIKGIIFKKFVSALRKLTSSQVTLTSQQSKERKAKEPYDEPDVSQKDPEAPVDPLYNTSPPENTEVFVTIAEATLATTSEDIYQTSKGLSQNPNHPPLYTSRVENDIDKHVGSRENLTEDPREGRKNEQFGNEMVNSHKDQKTKQTELGIEAQSNTLDSTEIDFSEDNVLNEEQDFQYDNMEEFDYGPTSIPRPNVPSFIDTTGKNVNEFASAGYDFDGSKQYDLDDQHSSWYSQEFNDDSYDTGVHDG